MYPWSGAYMKAVLETDWTIIHDRIQAAEAAIREREHVLSLDHGGTLAEQAELAAALQGLQDLRANVAKWWWDQSTKPKRTLGARMFAKFRGTTGRQSKTT